MREGKYAETWAEVHGWNPRELARHATLHVLAGMARSTGRVARALERPRVHLLYFHHVFPDEEAGFRELLRWLAAHHTFIPHSEALERIRDGRIDRQYVAFSFDDGLGSCVRAASILEEFGAKACFFVCPPLLGAPGWHEVNRFCRDQLAMPPTRFMVWRDVEDMLRRGHEIGSHTSSHRNLATLSSSELAEELEGSRDQLKERLGEVSHFAWPFGRFFHMSKAAASAVFAAGYVSCASAERGCHVAASGTDVAGLCVRRDQLVAAWPLWHSLFLLARSAERAVPETNLWPPELSR